VDDLELTEEEVRVIGCLLEKERTVPDSYPMTLNGLVTACNQSSNRWPVVAYDSTLVQRTVDNLKEMGLVRFVHPSHGERTTKYRQVIDERLALLPTEAAVLACLFVRGPQTPAELRTRTERLHAFDSTDEVEATLRSMEDRGPALVRKLDRRWTHVFDQPDAGTVAPTASVSGAAPAAPAATSRRDLEDRIAALEQKVEHLFSLLGELPPNV